MLKIALITPVKRYDYLTKTIIDGLSSLSIERQLEFLISPSYGKSLNQECNNFAKTEKDFLEFAGKANLVLLDYGKGDTDFQLAERVNQWSKMIYIDGSELARNRRYDRSIQEAVIKGEWQDHGKIDEKMLEKCQLYFRREKPYIRGIIPLPFGIESRYCKYYSPQTKKDIDFVCIFGQEEYPPLRKTVRILTEDYCRKHNLSCVTQKTKTQDEFYQTLARTRVGISVGGGGYDTARFWEILGNNCLLLTEKIDIYQPDSKELAFERIWQFDDADKFANQLGRLSKYLKTNYNQAELESEYQQILARHTSKARVETIIQAAKAKNLI